MYGFKRTLALVLTLVMLFTAVPVRAFGAENQSAEVCTENLTVEGTNGFGNLLSAAITEEQEQVSEYDSCYAVTDLTVQGNTAHVTYDAAEEALLIVALYTEDGMQMLTSAKTTVSPDATEATVTFEGTMPEYFLASAYLVDSYDFTPLCPVYETPMYTKDMQVLLNSTIHDYDEELVLNLDENETTNFAVFSQYTKVIEQVDGTNIVVSADLDNGVYVIENADEQFTALQPGQVVVYPYSENEILIAKVGTIQVSGTTVTLCADADIELEDVFDYMKLEILTDNSDFQETEDAVRNSYDGALVPMGDEDSTVEVKPIRYEFAGAELEHFDGYIEVKLENKMDFLYSRGYMYYRWELILDIGANFTVKVEKKDKDKEWVIPVLKDMSLVNISSFGLVFRPEFVFKASGSFTVNTTLTGSIGINCATGRDPINLSRPLKMSDQIQIEGEIFIGFDLRPRFYVLHEKVFYIEMGLPTGITLTGEMAWESTGTDGPKSEIHECNACIKGELSFGASLDVEIKFFDIKSIELGGSVSKKFAAREFYWSFTYGEMDWGSCPHKLYLVTVETVDLEGNPVADVDLMMGEVGVTTNESGIAQAYLPNGKNNISITYNGQTDSWRLTISGAPGKMKIILGAEHPEFVFEEENFGKEIGGSVADYGTVTKSGRCGDTVYWKQYSNNILQIYGVGDMDDYESNSDTPWHTGYALPITQVIIEDGVTSVGQYAFYYFTKMTSVTIPESVTSIGDRAFTWCQALREITLPKGLTYLGEAAFEYCDSLRGVITVPDGITEIKRDTFSAMSGNKLETIILPEGLKKIGYCAFYKCGINRITIPSTVTYIGGYAFRWCENIEKLIFTGDVPEIVSYAFENAVATVYYPADNATWTASVRKNYGGRLTWVPYTLDENGEMILPAAVDNDEEQVLNPNAIYGGEYSTEIKDTYTLKTASFSGLVPGEDYLLLALKSIEVEDPLGAENLLYVDQGTALADGTLAFTYIPRENAAVSYVIACGPSNKNLRDAEVTFPEMTADGEVQVVEPVVVYEGKTLVEDRDYVITGDVSFVEAGTYTCVIQGIRNYTGTVACTYTVNPGAPAEPEVPEEPEMPEFTARFTSISTSLGGNIAMNFYAELSENLVADPDAYLQFTFAGKTVIVSVSEGVATGNGIYRFSCPITSKNMTDDITAQFFWGEIPIGVAKSMAVDTYCNWVIANYTDTKTVNLMKAMLNYGASAQLLFSYRTDDLANAALSEADKAFEKVDASAFAHSVTGTEEGIKPTSCTLMLDSETAIRVYFQLTGDKTIDQYTFKVDGVEVTPVYKDGKYYIEKSDIGAHRLDEMHTFTCGNITITYGGLSYVNQVMKAYTSGNTFNMASALYAYSRAAEAYIG